LLNSRTILSPLELTDKYYTLRNTLSPRLKGLFGKTIKKLIPGVDSLNINPSFGYDLNLSYLKQIELVRDGGEDLESYVDLRFFGHPEEYEDNYFMIINRWYSKSAYNRFRLKLKDLLGYYNWNLKNFMDGTNTTLLPDQNGNVTSPTDTILIGDAILYSIKPVVLDGGTLLVDEYAGEGMILQDDMIITNGAKLSIVGNYYAKGDIIINDGSIDIYQDQYYETPKIHFQNGKKLIVKGPAVISGNEENKLLLDFISPDSANGIVIKQGGRLTISNSIVKNAGTGILGELNVAYLNAEYVDFIDCESSSIVINGQLMEERGISTPPPQIKSCNISNSVYGIWISNLPQMIIQQNQITNTDCGIYLSNVTSPLVLGNLISSERNEMPGIMFSSTNGSIRSNNITGHTDGIHLANSSPGIGGNGIHNNYLHGLYIGTGSLPDMTARLGGSPPMWYAVSGYNLIHNNGGWEEPSTSDNDGSEIYLNYSNVYLRDGCNRIIDNRLPDNSIDPPLVNTQFLMNGVGADPIKAEGNFWDEHQLYALEERFGNITVYYEPELSEPCLEPDGGSEEMILFSYSGEPIDTVYSIQREVGSLSSTELLYAEAEEKFISADYSGSETIYTQIVTGNEPVRIKHQAYKRLFEIGNLSFKPAEYFSALHSTYTSVSQTENDTLMKKLFSQLSALSLIGEVEYVSAITEFDNIINQNPNSEEAVYAEIDALTTSLLVNGEDTTLQKSAIGKYLTKNSGDSFSRIDGLLRKNFGVMSRQSKEVEIPKQYSLYQNYPNPFNPMTTIRFDLPKDGSVKLEVYDILGRKITTLINEYRSAGSYEQSFNASLLASGVYIYKLQAGDYVSSKKMMLLK
jgi:parallel beta-helix repeat protein